MAIVPHTVDIVVADMAVALKFYRTLGLDAPADKSDQMQVEIATPGGTTLGLIAEAAQRKAYPDWVTPVGQRVTFACKCDSAAELDEVYARMEAAGYPGARAPWDAFWGQRYAFLRDPDGNRVDLFAPLAADG